MKKVLIIVAALVLAIAVIPAATFLQITAPLRTSLTVEAYGPGESPTLNIIDNTAGDTAGANAGYFKFNDYYLIDFGAGTGRGPEIIPSRNQKVQVGNCEDYIFMLDNNYDKTMTLKLWVKKLPPKGLVIEVWENNTEGQTWLQFVIDHDMQAITSSSEIPPGETNGYWAHNPGGSYIMPSEVYKVFLVVKTGLLYTGHVLHGTSYDYNSLLKIVATSEPPYGAGAP
jgi:hypothetical protein